jgi:hypothetical protein
MINFKYNSPPLKASDIDEVESRFGFKFPQEFRELYLQCNGGRPERDRFVDERGTCIIDEFLPIKRGKYGPPLEDAIQHVKIDKALLPDYLVPFAIDPGGQYYCFSTRSADFGAICLYRMDGRRQGPHVIDPLAPSLTVFVGKLKSKPAT